jgi:glycosyltransferase involved in cell wall biosynthesis
LSERVSVVMAIYNGAADLPPTLASLRGQTFTDFELIIVDDGSTDSTWEALSGLDFPRLRLLRLGRNRGQTAALNAGIALARGEFVARHDTADESTPERLAKQVAYLEANPDLALVGSQVDWVDARGGTVHHFDYPTEHEAIRERLRTKNSFAHGSVMVRREALAEVGGYREPFRLAQDYDLWLRIAEKRQVANLPETLYRMRFGPAMASVARSDEQNAYAALARRLAEERAAHGKEVTALEQAALDLVAHYGSLSAIARRQQRAVNYARWAERLAWWGGGASAHVWPFWRRAVRAWPLSVKVWKAAARLVLRSAKRTKVEDHGGRESTCLLE